MSDTTWYVRAAGDTSSGRPVGFDRLVAAIGAAAVGDLDEVRGPGDADFVMVGEHPQTADHAVRMRSRGELEQEEAESDMTPMIDVTFQLVIFFMIAAAFTVQKTLELPPGNNSEEGNTSISMDQVENENILVEVTQAEGIKIKGTPVAIEDLVSRLTEEMAANNQSSLALDIEDDVVHETVVKVLDAAGAAQIESVYFLNKVDNASSGGG